MSLEEIEKMKGRIPWNKGKKLGPLSIETRKKISKSGKGRIVTQETRKKMRQSALGIKHSEEAKKKMSLAKKGKKHSLKHRQNQSKALLGHKSKMKGKTYEELYGKSKAKKMKSKQSYSSKKRYNDPNYDDSKRALKIGKANEGKIRTKELLIRLSAIRQGIPLSEWKGFSSYKGYSQDFSASFKRMIRKRDNCCMLCHLCFEDLKKLNRTIHVHHINYDKKLSIPQNCITLCRNCHTKTNFNRKYWIPFFQSMLTEIYRYKYQDNQVVIEVLN